VRTWYLTPTPGLTRWFCSHPEMFVLDKRVGVPPNDSFLTAMGGWHRRMIASSRPLAYVVDGGLPERRAEAPRGRPSVQRRPQRDPPDGALVIHAAG